MWPLTLIPLSVNSLSVCFWSMLIEVVWPITQVWPWTCSSQMEAFTSMQGSPKQIHTQRFVGEQRGGLTNNKSHTEFSHPSPLSPKQKGREVGFTPQLFSATPRIYCSLFVTASLFVPGGACGGGFRGGWRTCDSSERMSRAEWHSGVHEACRGQRSHIVS